MTAGMGDALDKVSSTLRHFAAKGRDPTDLSDTASGLSIAAPSAISRWHRLQSIHSNSSRSSFSSIRSLARGRPRLVNTPDAHSMYTGSDMNQYLSVNMTDPDAPTFLPSEARRLDTPALSTATSGRMRPGSYFGSKTQSAAETPMSEASSTALIPLQRRISQTDWYRVRLSAPDANENESCEEFVLSVPEHLPSSPMCPRHPKHKSKGKGVCVFHGRNVP